ncbi:hypothetical protein, partial [Pseudomonas viridiflava]
IIVTTIGFQSGAKEYADFYEMGLKIIRKPRGEDWDGYIQIVNIQIKFLRNHYIDFELSFDGKDQATRDIVEQDSSVMSTNSTAIVVRDEGHV